MQNFPFLLIFLAACGGAQASAPPPAPVASAQPPAPPPKRVASADLARAWPFAQPPDLAVYVDVAGLRRTGLAASLARALGPVLNDFAATPSGICAASAWKGASEAAVGGGDDGFVWVARFDAAPPLDVCVSLGTPTQVEGASRALDLGDNGVAAVMGNVVVAGPPVLVAAAMKGAGSPSALADLSLDTDQYVAARLENRAPPISARGTLLAADQRFLIDVGGTAPEGASMQAQVALAMARNSDFAKQYPPLVHLLDAVKVTQSGTQLQASFELDEAADDQARDLAMLSTVGVYSVRRYLLAVKVEEGRQTVRAIADKLSASAEHEAAADPPGTKKHAKLKLTSLPPVPAAMQHGQKYVSQPADWKDWAKIGFSMTEPQFFQYEVKAAKDGESADIIARSDLNGDGKESTVTLHVTLDRAAGKVVAASPLAEQVAPLSE